MEENAPQAAPESNAEQTVNNPAAPAEVKVEKVVDVEKKAPSLDDEFVEIKKNGKLVKMKFKEAKAYLQRDMAADEKFQEAAKKRGEMDTLIKRIKEDPAALRQFLKMTTGEEPSKIFERELARELEDLTMDPKEKELRKMKQELETYKKKEAQAREAEQQAKQKQAEDFWAKKYDEDISSALKTSGLPINEDTIRYAAEVMLSQIEASGDDSYDPPMEIVMDLVRDRYVGEFSRFSKTADVEKLLEILGDEQIEKLTKAAKGRKKSPVTIDPGKQAIADGSGDRQEKKAWKDRSEFEKRIAEWSKGE
jgi:hypothetical protein